MQIILLSGGSGKRLWPLSNNARSKQFLKLLPLPTGGRESMVQRVVRQLKEAGLKDSITVATSITQRDVITNQLGENVPVVTEPERRDTFPAIALATAFLAYEKKCCDEEVVVVMPCDPYTEEDYFKVIAEMAEAVRNNAAELVLMGIKPTYPSSKYGYVVSEKEDFSKRIRRVHCFTEKPDMVTAEKFIADGAMWNGGVFAFRLGYIRHFISKYIQSDDFNDIRSHYGELPKISFDYEVVEKAKSVAVIPFVGEWKDLGTWNTLTDELPDYSIGNVIMDDSCNNTHVINELKLPVMCIGAQNMIVAASCDGIIIADKRRSENIKTYADQLQYRPMYEEHRWGECKVLDITECSDGYKTLTKEMVIYAGKSISYQKHHHRDEVLTFIEGEGKIVLDESITDVRRGDMVIIKKGMMHALTAITDLKFIEVQSGDLLVEEDIERFDWR